MAALWTEDGTYVDAAGRSYNARQAIAEEFGAAAPQQRSEPVEVDADSSIRFVTPGVAIEEGKSAGATGGYSAIWVNKDGKWLLDSLREWEAPVGDDESPLDALAWIVGDWIGQGDGFVVRTSCNWSENHKFLVRRFSIERDGSTLLGGTERIGWDPAALRIRSWVFSSDGGIAEGRWRQEGNDWIVKTTGVAPDGRTSSAVKFLILDGHDRCVLRSSHVTIGDETIEDSTVQFERTNNRP